MPRPKRMRYVYFLRSGEEGPIKIGVAGNPMRRAWSIQASNPNPLFMMGVMVGGHRDERNLHKQFAHLRLRGEWFRPEPDLLDYIDEHAEQIELSQDNRRVFTVGHSGLEIAWDS